MNASHTGYKFLVKQIEYSVDAVYTAHLGVKFDTSYSGEGLKINDVIEGSSASQSKSLLELGEIIIHIDNQIIKPNVDLMVYLNGKIENDIRVTGQSIKGEIRELNLRPHNYAEIRELIYNEWLESNRKCYHALSDNEIGYVHVAKMK